MNLKSIKQYVQIKNIKREGRNRGRKIDGAGKVDQ